MGRLHPPVQEGHGARQEALRGAHAERQREWEEEQRTSQGGKLPQIVLRPEQTVDWSGFPAHTLANHAYDLQFSLLSGAIHGDLRTARMVARGAAQAVLPGDLAFAENAAVVLLMAVSLQLGFANDLEPWLDEFHPRGSAKP